MKNGRYTDICAISHVVFVSYQGNNLLCSDWDRSDMEGLDYNGLYEILYLIFDYPHKHYTFKHFEV